MDKKFEKIYETAEREGWQVDHSYTDEKETDIIFSFEKYSPAGRDFVFEVCVQNEDDEDYEYNLYYNVADAISTYSEIFDVVYETYSWLEANVPAKNEAPHVLSVCNNDK